MLMVRESISGTATEAGTRNGILDTSRPATVSTLASNSRSDRTGTEESSTLPRSGEPTCTESESGRKPQMRPGESGSSLTRELSQSDSPTTPTSS